jgi:copper transporter 1
MLWNWYTVGSCFIARSWRITSAGVFAGSCIGVILLVMALEFLRRAGKEYDRYLIRSRASKFAAAAADLDHNSDTDRKISSPCAAPTPSFRPNVLQQATRALLHMVQFAVAYFIML